MISLVYLILSLAYLIVIPICFILFLVYSTFSIVYSTVILSYHIIFLIYLIIRLVYLIITIGYLIFILYINILYLTFNHIIMLSLNLTPIFKARGINKPHSFLVKNGFSNFTATNLLSTSTRVFRLNYIEILCNILVCEPNDLLLFTPDKTKQYAPNNPLFKLASDDSNSNWPAALATMPFKELQEATKSITNKTNP